MMHSMGKINKIFKMKILRQKQLGVTVAVFLFAGLFLLGMYERFQAVWLNSALEEADEAREWLESVLRQEESLLDVWLNGIYASDALLQDLKRAQEAKSLEEYMENRRLDSKKRTETLRSFPSYLKLYIRRYDSALIKVGVSDGNRWNQFSFDSAVIQTDFSVPEKSPEREMNIERNVIISRPVYDISSFKESGTLTFFYDLKKLLERDGKEKRVLQELEAAALMDEAGNIYWLQGEQGETEELFRKAGQSQTETGVVRGGILNRCYYYVQKSDEYPFRLVTCTDTWKLLAGHGKEIIPNVFIVLAISLIFILIFFVNIGYDYHFINHIYESIASVNRVEFENSDVIGLANYRSNEYGQIARSLDEMCMKLKRHIIKEYQFKIKQQEAQMRALQNQINPHFLYNTLESIRSIALVNNDREAAEAMTALGSLYRAVVKGESESSLKEEAGLLEKYLKLMQLKYMGNFSYFISLDEKIQEIRTVKFWMQPLAENFFVHGFNMSRSYNVMVIEGKTLEKGWLFEMMDNGSGIPWEELEKLNGRITEEETEAKESIGLSNVYRRLKYFYGEGLTMRLSNNPEGGTKVSVWIPKGEDYV